MHRASRSVSLVAALAVTATLALAGLVSHQPVRAQNAPEPDVASVMLLLLGMSGVDYSVPEADLKQWLGDRENTPYPAVAEALLIALDGQRLTQPVYLDVIAWKYEQASNGLSPRDISEVDFDVLRAVVVEAYNERYGEMVDDFQSLLQLSLLQ